PRSAPRCCSASRSCSRTGSTRTWPGSSRSSSSPFSRRPASPSRRKSRSPMDARPASWSLPADAGRAALAALAASAVFAAAWAVVHYGFYADNHIIDTPVYQRYGDAIVAGRVPYKDFTVEYPPAALPAFAVPSLIVSSGASRDSYDRAFGLLMAICGAAAVALVAVT